MAIDSVLNPVGMAKKLSVPQLQKAIQNGLIPPYVGIPILEEKVQLEQRMRNASAQPQQGPTVAQQVMAQAQGLDQLPSGLPNQMAGGGIVAFARGGGLDGDMIDEEEDDEFTKDISRAMAEMDALRERASALDNIATGKVVNFPRSITFPGLTSTEVKKGVSIKEGSEPARTVEKTEKSISKPVGLEQLLSKVEQIESGGRRYGKDGQLLTSPKGALGEMQVMPATARDPGFGIRPAEVNDPNELRRVGREYYGKMLERYGDPKLAAIAYNMGPGATDKWLMAGADPLRLPDETRKYAQNFSEGGIASIKRFQYGGISGPMPYALTDLSLDDLTRMSRMGDPGAIEELARRRGAAVDPFSKAPRAIGPRPTPAVGATPTAAPAAPAAPAGVSAATPKAPGLFGSFGRLLGFGTLGTGLGEIGARTFPISQPSEMLSTADMLNMTPEEYKAAAERITLEPKGTAYDIQRRKDEGVLLPLKSTPTAPLPTATKPSSVQAPTGAGAGRGGQGGPTAEELATFAKEQEIGASQDFEDLERGLGMTEMARQKQADAEAAAKEKPTEPSALDKLRERIDRGYGKLEKQAESDKYLALLSAGLGMMGGTSPYAMSNIGRGGAMGIQALQQAEASRAAQERSLLSAELGAERYGQYGALQREQMAMRQQLAEAERQRKREAAEASMQQKREALDLRQQQMYGSQLKEIERMAQTAALAREKDAILPEKKEAIGAKALEDLRSDPGYRRLYKLVHGFDPMPAQSGNTISWDQLGK